MDEELLAASAKHPIVSNHKYTYGTAGFRMQADLLEGVSFRVGLLSSLRSRKLNGQAIGVMVTASHNPAVDNGVKIVDPMGEMLEQEWEAHATRLVNCPSDQDLLDTYKALATQLKVDLNAPARVIYGRDTRPSGHSLVAALADALQATGAEFTDYKILTTPQLHYLVRCTNTEGTPKAYGVVSEIGYYEKLADAFARALRYRNIQGQLQVDCANGVGGPKLSEFLKYVSKDIEFDVKVVNDDVLRPEVLNLEVSFAISNCLTLTEEQMDTHTKSQTPRENTNAVLSAVPISSRPSSVLRPTPDLQTASGVAPWMEMQIASYTTGSTRKQASSCSMVIEFPPSLHLSSAT